MENVPAKWTAAHRLAGAALYLRLTYDPDAFPGGIPNITVDIEGKDDVLDPRSGTRGYSENPALCLADYLAHPAYGLGAGIGAADGVERASLIEAANICDEIVHLASGGVERRYSCNGVVSLAETPKTIIEGLLSAMAGRVAVQGGSWRIHAGAYRLPEVTLGADDVRAGGLVLATRVSQSENFNAVRGQFVSPENDWQPDDFPAYASEAYLAEDGGERKWRDISLPFTISAATAQRLAKIELERARRQMTVKLAGKLAAWRAGVGETVMLSYARWGFAAKPFEVQGARSDRLR
ncbi:phage tail protein [Tabrizicola soli]|uniref:phage tail protein n=1 Tax=Tabrizicola soli TaxID=2185115 RepID=UPI003628755A